MRAALLASVVALASGSAGTARADRIPVVTLGATMDMRFSAPTWHVAETKQTPDVFGGGQLTLAFEDRPMPLMPHGAVAAQGRLVPELIAGSLVGDRYAEGYIGAGLRAELQIASERARAGFYVAGRGLVIGLHRDSAAEFVAGDYIIVRGATRIGVEGGAMVRPQDRDGNHELDAVMRLYVGWRI